MSESTAAPDGADVTNTPAPEEDLWAQALADVAEHSPSRALPAATEPAAQEPVQDPAPDAPAAPVADDIWANATEAQRTAFQAAQERAERAEAIRERQRNQQSALDRKVTHLTRELEARKAAPAAEEQPDITGVMGVLETKLADYPDVLDGLKEVLGPVTAALANVQTHVKTTAAASAAEVDDALEANAIELEAALPGWQGMLQANGDAFRAFVADEDQPAWVAKAWKDNENDIVDPDRTAKLLQRFMEVNGIAATAPSRPATGTPEPRSDSKRQRQLAAAAALPPAGGGPVVTTPPETSTDWGWALQQVNKRR